MDILSHGLWAAVGAKALNTRRPPEKRASLGWAAWWGVFPDLFAFGVPMAIFLFQALSGDLNLSDLPRPRDASANIDPRAQALFELSPRLYQVSHSLVIWLLVAALVYFLLRRRKRIPWELGGWLFHILCDIPTHSAQFYPTPLFWPLSDWRFVHGFSWGQAWFMVLNYSLLALAAFFVWRKSKRPPPS